MPSINPCKFVGQNKKCRVTLGLTNVDYNFQTILKSMNITHILSSAKTNYLENRSMTRQESRAQRRKEALKRKDGKAQNDTHVNASQHTCHIKAHSWSWGCSPVSTVLIWHSKALGSILSTTQNPDEWGELSTGELQAGESKFKGPLNYTWVSRQPEHEAVSKQITLKNC